jgi:hypothetical protein
MTRSKKKPSLHKPPFDEENALRFAEMEPLQPGAASGRGKGGSAPRIMEDALPGKGPQQERLPITLRLKSDTITILQHEAGRKGKAIDQIIDKLVAKHLGKNK